VRDAITRTIITLPEELRRSLTWIRGPKWLSTVVSRSMRESRVYFCDPRSPGSARHPTRNTNGLLRQYFPKGTDLSIYELMRISAVAAALNARPRKTLDGKPPRRRLTSAVPSEKNRCCDDRLSPPVVRLVPVVTPPAFCLQADHGCGQHPAFPAPSDLRGRYFQQLGRETRRENAAYAALRDSAL